LIPTNLSKRYEFSPFREQELDVLEEKSERDEDPNQSLGEVKKEDDKLYGKLPFRFQESKLPINQIKMRDPTLIEHQKGK
jgi:hypothetical protein